MEPNDEASLLGPLDHRLVQATPTLLKYSPASAYASVAVREDFDSVDTRHVVMSQAQVLESSPDISVRQLHHELSPRLAPCARPAGRDLCDHDHGQK
jgi:hypothetical protein